MSSGYVSSRNWLFFNGILQMDMILTNYQLSNIIWAWLSHAIHLLLVKKWENCNTPVVDIWGELKSIRFHCYKFSCCFMLWRIFLNVWLLNHLTTLKGLIFGKNDNRSLNWEFVTLYYLLLILLQSILKLTIYRFNIEFCRYILIRIIEIWHACKQKSIFFIFKENM